MTDQPERPQSEDPKPESPKYGEPRPRPQYGEYATPQEQAKIIADSFPPERPLPPPAASVSPASASPASGSHVPETHQPGQPVAGAPVVADTPRAGDAASRSAGLPPAAAGRRRRWDIILTAGLLGYATINVIAQLLARDTLATIATQFFVSQGIGDYTPTALTASLGTTLNVITLALFVITVLVTTWMLRSGRIAFWVPITGGVVATIVALVFVVILLQADPAFVQLLDRTRR